MTRSHRAQPAARRGVVFLFSAFLLVAILLIIMYGRTLPTERERTESISVRIGTMNDFLKDLHADVHRATFIAGFRSLIAIEQYSNEHGAYLADPEQSFVEAFMNGTINGTAYEVLNESTFGDYLARVNAEANAIGIVLNISVSNVTLGQSTPWSVDVAFDMAVNVTDTRGLARWDYDRRFATEVSILDLRDPAYSVLTYGKVPNTFRISPYNNTDFVDGNDTTNLHDEIANMYYREDPYAPSFLQRLAGNLTGSSKYGIASLVDLDELSAQGLYAKTYLSDVDYLYFSNTTTTVYCPGKGEPLQSWLKIDQEHYLDAAHDYGLQELNSTVC